jgi:hypothetical protein
MQLNPQPCYNLRNCNHTHPSPLSMAPSYPKTEKATET